MVKACCNGKEHAEGVLQERNCVDNTKERVESILHRRNSMLRALCREDSTL